LFQLKGQGHTIPKEHITIGETFTNAGYNTYMVGKWHQDNAALARSFNAGGTIQGRGLYLVDHFRQPYHKFDKRGEFASEDIFMIVLDENGKRKIRKPTKEDKRGPVGTEFDGPHSSEIYAESASEFINDYDKNEPFFMYLAFHAPHDPRQAPQNYRDMYPPDEIELMPSYMPQHPFDNGHLYLRDEQLAPWPRTPEIARRQLADYYSIITHLDAQIGKVIAALKESGQYENTIIVFAGDSGLGVGNHGLLGKQNVYDEDGIHVPFIISGGKAPKHGVQNNAFSYIHDIFPTVCDLAGVEAPGSVNGLSMVPVINGEKEQVRNYTYHAYRTFQRAYRKGDFKLIEYVRAPNYDKKTKTEYLSGSRVTQLFNLKSDPWETSDLSWLPEYKEILKTMRLEMKEKATELGDKKESVGEMFDFWDYID
jgi:arylsulfatase A-like enzyme